MARQRVARNGDRHRLFRARRGLSRITLVGTSVSCLLATFVAGGVATSAEGAVTRNLVTNPSFEISTRGWVGSPGTVLSRSRGYRSAHAARLTNRSTSSRTVVLNDKVNTVTSTSKGRVYRASAYVRTNAPGTTVSVRLKEHKSGILRGKRVASVWLTTRSWHKITLQYVARTRGASLDLNAIAWRLHPGRAFIVDRVRLVMLATTSAQVPAPSTTGLTPVPTGWRQVWSDEFNGSSVDSSKWRVRNNTFNSYEISCQTSRSKNVSVSGGVLHIRAQRENYNCNGYPYAFTSGYLDTIGKMSTTYGRYEMRAKMPTQAATSKGLWPAFWLRPNDGGLGELDIMEAVGSAAGENNYARVSQTIWYDYNGTYPKQGFSASLPSGNTMSDSYHTYALEWEPGVLRWLVDDKVTYTRNSTQVSWITAAFSRPFHIRLNMQVGGSWPGTPNGDTAFPGDFAVDWVRVYQR